MKQAYLRRPSQQQTPISHGLWSLWDMLESYFPIYQIALRLAALRNNAEAMRRATAYTASAADVTTIDANEFQALLTTVHQACLEYNFTHTAEMAKRTLGREPLPPERTTYFERNDLFGPAVASAFPSCERDIEKAGSCYALAQEDACVHHLMLVLERGLAALATQVGIQFHYTDWKKLIDLIEAKLKSGAVSRGPELDFYPRYERAVWLPERSLSQAFRARPR